MSLEIQIFFLLVTIGVTEMNIRLGRKESALLTIAASLVWLVTGFMAFNAA